MHAAFDIMKFSPLQDSEGALIVEQGEAKEEQLRCKRWR